MKEYINNIIVPYVQRKRKDLKLASNYPALAIYDEFKGQLTPRIFSLLDANHIFVVKVAVKRARRAPHAKKPKQYITTLRNLLRKDKPTINIGNFVGATKISFREEKLEVLYSQYR